MSLRARRQPAKAKSSTKGYCIPSFYAKRRVFVLAALVVAGLARPAVAQTYPTQNITFQVAFAAGGIADGRGIVASFALGAAGAQVGTAYLICREARIASVSAPAASASAARRASTSPRRRRCASRAS